MSQSDFQFSGKQVWMIGIGGSSMSGLARMLQARGALVSGSDRADTYSTRKLRESGIPVQTGHGSSGLPPVDLVVYSAAIAADNPELQWARSQGIPTMERAELLGQLSRGHRHSIAVAGTHGKTTTTAMLAQMLVACDTDPTVHIGGVLDTIGGSIRLGRGDLFLTEACEYKGSFLTLSPSVAVILNIDWDHPDFFRDIHHTVEVFGDFMKRVPKAGCCVGNGDDPRILTLMQGLDCQTLRFGLGEQNDLRPLNLREDDRGRAAFTAVLRGEPLCQVSLSVPGDFQVLNALAALGAASCLGLDLQKAADALSGFTGARRRFELTSIIDGVQVYHDYGHNPQEMRGALRVAKRQPHNRLWAVVQPHTYSRLKLLLEEYVHCCDDADVILVTDICAAREIDPGDIHSTMLVDRIAQSGKEVHYTPTFDDTEAYLRDHWQAGDLVLTMGCGDINQLNDQIEAHEREKRGK